ncbi:MAG TPA: glycosyltransferase family 39 protein [Verrucomicrobiae bacterium]|nr:glycosyltransferase family 39 protein [Verrucomicrobiae bacterium]
MALAQRLSASPFWTILVLSLALFLSGNWVLPLMDRDEPRFAEASREMLARGDLVTPWFNAEFRFDKPPLIYWCQMACYRLLGENAFAARLPSALFATATAVLLLFWGRRMGNERAGLYAALMLSTCLQFLIHGRLAVADMPMVFFVSVAFWSGWEMTRPEPKPEPKWFWVFYLSLGLGFLAKGPVAWLPLAGLMLARWFHPGDFQLPVFKTVCGLVVALFVVGVWGVPALLETRGQFFTVGIGHHVVFRSFGIMEGHGGPGWLGWIVTLPLYLITFFVSFFPWAFKVPFAVSTWWHGRRQDLFGSYLLLQAAVVFAVFTLVRTKLPHYTLPAFPAISLWLAMRMTCTPDYSPWIRRGVISMCVLSAGVTLLLFRAARPYFVAATLWRQAGPFCSRDMELAAVGFNEPSLVWEFRRGVTNYLEQLTIEQAGTFLAKPSPHVLILPTRDVSAELRGMATNALMFEAAGLDTARFRRIDLTAIVKPAAK